MQTKHGNPSPTTTVTRTATHPLRLNLLPLCFLLSLSLRFLPRFSLCLLLRLLLRLLPRPPLCFLLRFPLLLLPRLPLCFLLRFPLLLLPRLPLPLLFLPLPLGLFLLVLGFRQEVTRQAKFSDSLLLWRLVLLLSGDYKYRHSITNSKQEILPVSSLAQVQAEN
jgi:hypothetical protein